MPQILTKQNILANPDFFIAAIKAGKIFAYPTDTLYGLGGNACDDAVVAKINAIKGRSNKPLLVVTPSWQWLKINCDLSEDARQLMETKWPGAYSFILPLKNQQAVSAVLLNGGVTIGVRWPDHWLSALIQTTGVPFISTSANLSGEPPAKTCAEIKPEILDQVDYVINDDEGLSGQPSAVFDFSSGTANQLR